MRPSRFVRKGRRPDTRAVLVCVGDSITHGVGNANYVKPLARRLAADQIQVVNAGVSADLAVNVLRRLDKIIACRPDLVTLLIGTNDVAAQIDDKWRKGYELQKRLSEPPTLETFRAAVDEIVRRLTTETSARVALVEIPIMGEDLGSVHNERVRQYNQTVHSIADAYGVPVLPLRQRLVEALPASHRATAFDGTKKLMSRAILAHLLRRRTWDDIAGDHGLALMTDNIHLSDRGAALITDLVEQFALSAIGLESLHVQDVTIPVEGATIRGRLYLPPSYTAALLWIHGGGFMTGSIDMAEGDVVSRTVARAGFAVLSVDYRLVPKRYRVTEHHGAPAVRFPTPVLDCLAGWRRLVEEVGTTMPIFVGGASAGADLAVMSTLRASGAGLAAPTGVVLAYPLLHGAMPPRPDRGRVGRAFDAIGGYGVSFMGRAFTGTKDTAAAFPGPEDLPRLPPMVIVTSEKDGLRLSGETFAADLAAAGGEVTIRTELGARHGHLNNPWNVRSPRTIATFTDWMASHVAVPQSVAKGADAGS